MKFVIAAFLLTSMTFAQTSKNAAAQQGIAIVEMMEKEAEAELPAFCRSVKKKDKIACDEWLKAQDDKKPDLSAAHQGIAIVEQMEKTELDVNRYKGILIPDYCKSKNLEDRKHCEEFYKAHSDERPSVEYFTKDQEGEQLPPFCKSTTPKDKEACDAWIRARIKFRTQVKTNPAEYYKLLKEDPSLGMQWIDEPTNKQYIGTSSIIKDFKESCADNKLSEEEKQQCNEYAEYMSHQPIEEDDERLLGCTMSADSSEITCGDKVYRLSGQVSNSSRINSKVDLQGSSKPKKNHKQIKAKQQ